MKESQTELNQANSASSAAAALKIKRSIYIYLCFFSWSELNFIFQNVTKANSGNYAGSQLDAKEQAKKLVQSGVRQIF